jgi:hypothetical protein
VRYGAVNAMLINEFLKEHRKVKQLEKRIETLTASYGKWAKSWRAASRSRSEVKLSESNRSVLK